MKRLYIARCSNGNNEECRACLTIEEARAAAVMMLHHLTARERKVNTVSVETYAVDVPADDPRDAHDLFMDLLDEDVEELLNPIKYEEIEEA